MIPGRIAPLAELLGESPGVVVLREQIERLLQRQTDARRLSPLLLQGETGTGKGLLARAIHRAGPRATGPFVGVNCAAIPETLLEAELFGFERGAFTDARQAKPGLFQAAHRGTLFLDEVGLLPEGLQAKLLTVLEERMVRRLGSTRSEPADVWILAASNEDLAAATRARRFREDLYHRLAVLTLWLPPLRERGQDILLLAEHFLARACADYGLSPKTLASDARDALLAYPWPGNVRELANVIERVALLTETPVVTAAMLGLPAMVPAAPRETRRAAVPVQAGGDERDHLLAALSETSWNISQAATRLGLSRNTLRYRIEKYGLRRGMAPALPERPAAPTPAGPAAGPAPAGVRWERRRLALLGAILPAPPEAASLADASRALEVLVDKVQGFGGQIEELSPTGLVAVFGIEPVEDAPRRAAHAAMAIQKAAERARRGDPERVPPAKVGLHVAQGLVGRVGGMAALDRDARREAWTALDALVAEAEPGAILVSAPTASFLERRFELVPVGSSERAPAQAYRLTGRERTGLGPGGRVAKFVGRNDELALLRSRLATVMKGHGQVVGIVGEAGIGKSRLLYEFRQGLGGEQVTYLEGRCLSYGTGVPYLPVADMLRSHCCLVEADSPKATAEKVRLALAEIGMEAEEATPHLLQVLGVKEGTQRLDDLSPEAVKARTFEILREMSLKGSRRRPLVLAVEDVHWIDTTSETYLAYLVDNLPGASILLVVTYRPGYRPPWTEKSYATQIAIEPLSPAESRSVVHSVLDADEVSDTLVDAILSKAEGNPLFLEELARVVREQAGSSPLAVPDTIEEVLRARIDRLPLEDKRLLQLAAVVGKDVPFSIVQAVAEQPEEPLRHRLMRLQAGEFLYQSGSGPAPEYTFQHVLTHEVAYGSLLQEERPALHARVFEAIEAGIERLGADRLTEHAEQLAHHAFRGQAWEKAVKYLRRAGDKAFGRSAYREAVACFEQALVALGKLEPTRETLEQGIDIRFGLRNALWALGELRRGLQYLLDAEPLAESLGDQRRLARLAAHRGSNHLVLGDNEDALQFCKHALFIATTLDDFTLKVDANQFLGVLYYTLGDYRGSIQVLEPNIDALVAKRPGRFRDFYAVHGLTFMVLCLAELGEFEAAAARADDAIRIAEPADDPHNVAAACCASGYLHCTRGDHEAAIPVLERSLQLCRASNIAVWLRPNVAVLGHAYALSGRRSEALPLLEQAMKADENNVALAAWTTHLGEAYTLAGRLDDAANVARQALALARERRELGFQAYALRLIAEIAARRDAVAEAAEHFRQAMALASEQGMRPLVARCHFGLATLYSRAGRQQQADGHLQAANALFHQMNMRP